MTTSLKLTDTQRKVLEHATDHTDGRVVWFPDGVRGGAQKKVIDGLFSRAFIINDGAGWLLAAEAYDALGRPRPVVATVRATTADEAAVVPPKAVVGQLQAEAIKLAPRSRENSKQATVLAMLQRPEGATIRQVCEATNWQAHTVRGTFAGAFKKKLGLNLTSDKPSGGDRVYRVPELLGDPQNETCDAS
jgi:hypothetical protein